MAGNSLEGEGKSLEGGKNKRRQGKLKTAGKIKEGGEDVRWRGKLKMAGKNTGSGFLSVILNLSSLFNPPTQVNFTGWRSFGRF